MTRIAVLPFSNLAPDSAVDYLQFALPDEVITILSYNQSIAIRPFASTRRFGDSDPQEAGRTLKVDKIITGHYRSSNGQLAVTVEAIDVVTNRVVWRNSLSIASSDLMSLRDAISTQLRVGLVPALGIPGSTKDNAQPTHPEAYSLYLKAVSASSDRQPTLETIVMLERAVALDPNYAPAWNELGRRYYLDATYAEGGRRAREQARSASGRALALDPESVSAARRMIVLSAESGELARAYRQALELVRRRPRSAEAHFTLGYTFRYAGRLKEAARECETAYSLDPSYVLRSCANAFVNLGNYARAHDFARMDEGSEWADGLHVSIWLREGKRDEALATLKRMPVPRHGGFDLTYGCIENGTSNHELAERLERQALSYVDSEPMYFTASEMAFCGENSRALRLLRKALEKNYVIYPGIDTDPLFASLRSDPEFLELRAAAISHREMVLAQLQQIDSTNRSGATDSGSMMTRP